MGLMVLFTFYDYKITNALYNPQTGFGMIFEAIGPMFMPFIMIYSTLGLIILLNFKRKVSKVFAYIGLGFSYIYATFMGVMTHKHSYAPWMFIPSIIIYVLFTVFVIVLNLKLKKASDDIIDMHIRIMLIMFITASFSLIGMDIIKSIFGRVRYTKLTDPSGFRYWFWINSFDFNSSFPSGHASRSMATVCFALIPLYWGKKKLSLFIQVVAITFAVTVSISRLFEGMHYPTDIITGMSITYMAFLISRQKLYKKCLRLQ